MRDEMVSMGLPRPGKALLWVMGVLVSIWVMFAFSPVQYMRILRSFSSVS